MMRSLALGSPRPGTGRAQYSSPANSRFFSRPISRQWSRRRGQRSQAVMAEAREDRDRYTVRRAEGRNDGKTEGPTATGGPDLYGVRSNISGRRGRSRLLLLVLP